MKLFRKAPMTELRFALEKAAYLLALAGAFLIVLARQAPAQDFGSPLRPQHIFASSNLQPPVVSEDEEDFTEIPLEELAESVPARLESTRQATLEAGVLGAHYHNAGEWMVGYSYMSMNMRGNRSGTTRQSIADVIAQGFIVVPTDMQMEMQMFHFMYAPTDELTLMVMPTYIRNSMNHFHSILGVNFQTVAEGFGDTHVTAIYKFWEQQRDIGVVDDCKDCWSDCWQEQHTLHFNFGLSFPTGLITARHSGTPPPMPGSKLPYPMQLGSGTYDILTGITYLGLTEDWAWGAKYAGTFRLGSNTEFYKLGDRHSLYAWLTRKMSDSISVSSRIEGHIWDNVYGADPDLGTPPFIVPTADPTRRGGDRIDVWMGISYYFPDGALEGNMFSFEAGAPIYQSLNGPQLEVDWQFLASWIWTF